MPHYTLEIKLTLLGPLLTRATAPAGYGVDAPFFRMGSTLCLPASLVEGKLREALRELAALPESGVSAGQIGELMGRSTDSGDFSPARGKLHLGDFLHHEEPAAGAKQGKKNAHQAPFDQLRYRVSIDPGTRSAKEQMLQVLESPFQSGQTVHFAGEGFLTASEEELNALIHLLRLGFRWMRQVGAARTIGFGSVQQVEIKQPASGPISEPKVTAKPGTPAEMKSEALLLRITPLAPLCFSEHRSRENVMTSREEIPGAAIIGCLARVWPQDESQVLDLLTISHAFPAAPGAARPMRTPLSMAVSTENVPDRWVDLAAEPGSCLLDGHAPSFRLDWKEKDFQVDEKVFGWKRPERELRVRTAIDPKKRAADEGQLFSQELVLPEGCEWLARVDFSRIEKDPQRAHTIETFRRVLGDMLHGLGKTKARAKVEIETWSPESQCVSSSVAPREDRWIVVLQTPALLCDPRLLAGPGKADVLAPAYAAAWEDISGGLLRLDHFYGRQHLQGGKYLWKRFQGDQPYNPWLLTDAGSVFVLSLAAGQNASLAQSFVEQSLARGLPLPGWAEALYGAHWSQNPFLPQNGYGEIAVNPAHFDELAPTYGQRVRPFRETLAPIAPLEGAPKTNPRAPIAKPPSEKVPEKDVPENLPDRWIITGTFTTASPLHVGTGLRGRLELVEGQLAGRRQPVNSRDTVVEYQRVARDHEGKPLIPGSGWKGPVRAVFPRKAILPAEEDQEADRILGKENTGGRFEFHAATFKEFAANEKANVPHWDAKEQTGIEANVALDRRTGTAAEQKLFHTEFVPAGAVFNVRLTAQDVSEGEIKRLLTALASFTGEPGAPTLGAGGANGWGRVRWTPVAIKRFGKEQFSKWLHGNDSGYDACEACAETVALMPDAPATPAGLAIAVTVKFHSPLLVRQSEPKKRSGDETTPNARPRQTAEGHALLPASSFRGALRSQCERILRTLLGDTIPRASGSATKAQAVAPDPSASKLEALHDSENPGSLSLAAQVFGAAGWRSTLDCADFISAEPLLLISQKGGANTAPALADQEFVAIDRFTGGAADGRKFKWRAAWPATATVRMDFKAVTLRLDLDRLAKCGTAAEQWAPGLIALALRDLAEGDITFGAGASKGYGACTAEVPWLQEPETAAYVAAFQKFVCENLPPAHV